jgi:hypothetical protein
MTPEYKAAKVDSVSMIQGGGIWEINILTFLAPVQLPYANLTRSRELMSAYL